MRVDPTPTDFYTLTKDVIMSMQAQIKEKDLTVKLSYASNEHPMIPMDRDIVWQVIQNIVSNAVRYSPKKQKIIITIDVDNKKKELVYSVQDFGIGIPKRAQSRIFEKFFRAENAVKSVPEGSGLGMSLVKRIVEDWKGRLWFTSIENKGSTFSFTVPLKGVKSKEGEVRITV